MYIFFFLLLIGIGAGSLFVMCMRESQRAIEGQVGFAPQPSTTDDEFCKMMPDIPPEIALEVRQICADVSGWDRDEIHPNTRLIEFDLW